MSLKNPNLRPYTLVLRRDTMSRVQEMAKERSVSLSEMTRWLLRKATEEFGKKKESAR